MEFVKEFRKCRTRILCNIVLDKISCLFFPRSKIALRRILGTFFLFIISEIAQVLIFLSIRQPLRPIVYASILGSLVFSLSFFVVSWCYQYTLDQLEKVISISAIGENLDKRLAQWLRKLVNFWAQFLTSFLAVGLIIFSIYYFEENAGTLFEFNITMIIVISLSTFGIMQGGYWAIVTPLFSLELGRSELSEIGADPLFPSKTPLLVASARTLSVFAIWDAVMVTLFLISLIVLRSTLTPGSDIYIVALVLMGYAMTCWTFLLPQFRFGHLVQSAKENTLRNIRLQIR